MTKLIIVTDSACDLSVELSRKFDIVVIPLHLIIDGIDYSEGVNLTSKTNNSDYLLTREQFLEKLKGNAKVSTSQSSLGYVEELYETLYKEKGADILSIHLTSLFSGTYNTASTAANFAMKNNQGLRVKVIDSWTLGLGQGTLAIRAAEMASAGQDIDTIAQTIEKLKSQVDLWGVLTDLKYARRSGRTGVLSSFFGSVLQINPIVRLKEGKPYVVGRPRTQKQALAEMIERFTQEIKPGELQAAGVVYVDTKDEALRVTEEMKIHYPDLEISCIQTNMVLSAYFGPGFIGIWGFKK